MRASIDRGLLERSDAISITCLTSQNGEIIKIDTDKDTMVLTRISPDGKCSEWVITRGTVYFWKVDSGELVRTMNCLSWAHMVTWSPDGRKIAMLCIDYEKAINGIQVVDATSFQTLWTVEKSCLRIHTIG